MKSLLLLFSMIFSSYCVLYSQNPPCHAIYGIDQYHGLTFQVEKLEDNPPLSIYMPEDVIKSYLYLDSLQYNITYYEFQDFLNRQNTYNDSLKNLIKCFYIAKDYDPIKFKLFAWYYDTNQTFGVDLIERDLLKKLKEISPDYFFDYTAIFSDYIFHIEIDSIIKRYEPFKQDSVLIATGTIIDTISGKVIPSCKNLDIPNSANEYVRPDPNIKRAFIGECIQFQLFSKYFDNLDCLAEGKEYIVFLSISHFCNDSLNSIYYYLYPTFNYSELGALYPILDSNVYDPENELGLGNLIFIGEFKKGLRERLHNLGNYTKVNDSYLTDEMEKYSIKNYPNPFNHKTNLIFNVTDSDTRAEVII